MFLAPGSELRKSPLRREIAGAISERSRAVKVPTRGKNGVVAQKFHRCCALFANALGRAACWLIFAALPATRRRTGL